MNTDNLITPEGLAASLKVAAEAMKQQSGVMKSGTTAKRDKKGRSSFLYPLICPALSGYP